MKKNSGFGKNLDKYISLLEELADYTEYQEYTSKWLEGDALSLVSVDPNNTLDLYDLSLLIEGVEGLVKKCREARSKGLTRIPDWDEDYDDGIW